MRDFKFLNNNPRINWKTADGTIIPLEQVHTGHITNIMKCLLGLGNKRIPDTYEGKTRREWYFIFHNEIIRRRNLNLIVRTWKS